MFRKIFDRESLEVVIISCGDTGQSIGAGMIQELKKHKVKVKSVALGSKKEDHPLSHLFSNKIRIGDERDGFAKQLEDCLIALKDKREDILGALSKHISKNFDGLVLITTGPGATGLGATLTVLDIVYNEYDLKPPILTLLPEIFENSRVQYNSAKFLFEVQFKENALKNPIILLDNKPSLLEMNESFREVAKKRLDTIPTAVADLLLASYDKTISEEYDAHVADLFDVMHTQGISVFVTEELGDQEGNLESSRLEDVVSDSVIETTSLTKDDVFQAKAAFVAIYNITNLDSALDFETKKLVREFKETRPFVKFVNLKEKRKKAESPKLRAIVGGLPIPPRILQIMRLAKDSRKQIIIDERYLEQERLQINISKVEKLEKELVAKF